MLQQLLSYCSWRFLLPLRPQHPLCDPQVQHPHCIPGICCLPDAAAAARLYFLSLLQPELPSPDELIDIQNLESQSGSGRAGHSLPGTARDLQEK